MFRLAAILHLLALALLCAGLQRKAVDSERDLIAARSASLDVAMRCVKVGAPVRLRIAQPFDVPQLPVLGAVAPLVLRAPGRSAVLLLASEPGSRVVDQRERIRMLRRPQHRPPALADA